MPKSISAVAPHHEKAMSESTGVNAPVTGVEHWTKKGDVRLFLWEKFVDAPDNKPAVLFVHGSSMASQPTFDLKVAGRADSSVMDWFARRGFVCWSVDMEGYGRSDKNRDITRHRQRRRRPGPRPTTSAAPEACRISRLRYFFGRAARSTVRAKASGSRRAPGARRIRLDRRRKSHAGTAAQETSGVSKAKRRPIDKAFVYSIFERDHPECADKRVIDAFADAILALDSSMPNGTYIDMCSKLPIVDPAAITARRS